jgi:2-amino-4-hydroxy-6-hydroxymethyldihydropteridine diphosphokinase
MEVRAAIAIGSNLGDRRAHVGFAINALARLPSTELVGVSDVIETEPVGPAGQGRYLNAAAVVATRLSPRELLARLLSIERERGRERSAEARWGPRALDLDLLVYGDLMVDEPGLTLPHPRLRERRFVLEPLARVAPDLRVPPDGASVAELLARLSP